MTEFELQKIIHGILADPSVIRKTESGKRLQVMSPGNLNVFGGPDFNDSAILLDGLVIVGDIEVHWKSSDWIKHNHATDSNYDRVILHVVIDNDRKIEGRFETLQITSNEIDSYIKSKGDVKPSDTESLEELQHFALIRLLRKSSDAQKILNERGVKSALITLVESYIDGYNNRRKRPVYSELKLNELQNNLSNSQQLKFLLDIDCGIELSIADRIIELMKSKIASEGAHLRREILLNCVLPLAICIANEQSRIALFLWYWSTPSLNKYGVLKRKFPDLPQNYLWEQQGMLEYMKEYGKKSNVVREVVKNYGFAEILSFYKIGNSLLNNDFKDA